MNVDTSDFERRAEHLGEEVGLADENLEARLHEKFDHQLGTLDEEGVDLPAGVTSDSAARFFTISEITKLLANPNSLRNAIVLSEISRPPTIAGSAAQVASLQRISARVTLSASATDESKRPAHNKERKLPSFRCVGRFC